MNSILPGAVRGARAGPGFPSGRGTYRNYPGEVMVKCMCHVFWPTFDNKTQTKTGKINYFSYAYWCDLLCHFYYYYQPF